MIHNKKQYAFILIEVGITSQDKSETIMTGDTQKYDPAVYKPGTNCGYLTNTTLYIIA